MVFSNNRQLSANQSAFLNGFVLYMEQTEKENMQKAR